jgi:hypothetical protein
VFLLFLTTYHFCHGVALLWKLTCFFASHNTHSWHDLPLFEREIPGRYTARFRSGLVRSLSSQPRC